MNATPAPTKASWSATRRRTPECPAPPPQHAEGWAAETSLLFRPRMSPRGLRKSAGRLSRAFSSPLGRGHASQPTSSARGPTCPVAVPADRCPSRPISWLLPRACLQRRPAVLGPVPRERPAWAASRIVSSAQQARGGHPCAPTPRPHWLPRWHKVSMRKATSYGKHTLCSEAACRNRTACWWLRATSFLE